MFMHCLTRTIEIVGTLSLTFNKMIQKLLLTLDIIFYQAATIVFRNVNIDVLIEHIILADFFLLDYESRHFQFGYKLSMFLFFQLQGLAIDLSPCYLQSFDKNRTTVILQHLFQMFIFYELYSYL